MPSDGKRCNCRSRPSRSAASWRPAARSCSRKKPNGWSRAGLGKRATYQNLLVFDKDGPVDNELRFRDECVRHKALDLVGDLALAGCDLVGHFVAHRSGHRLNAELVRALLNEEEIVEGRRRIGLRRARTKGQEYV